jgi:hypothetical protein
VITHSIESRLQRFGCGDDAFPGALPQAAIDAAPSAR